MRRGVAAKKIIFAAMKWLRHIVGLGLLLAMVACGKTPQRVSPEVLEEAQCQYDQAYSLLQSDSLSQAFPLLLQVAEKLESLPEDMDSAAMRLAAQAYLQMAYVFRMNMENNAEVDALRRGIGYQERLADTCALSPSWLGLAGAFQVLGEPDSAQVYLDRVWPCADTVSAIETYLQAVDLQSALCFDRGSFDSCFLLQCERIAFKARRAMDMKNDSVSLGMFLFFSGDHAAAKPYLLKVMEADFGDVERGAIMSLLAQVYEEEHNADSAAFCHGFTTTYVQAESERVSDGMLALKQYENYMADRDARMTSLREQKQARKATVLRVVGVIVALLMAAAAVFMVYQRANRKRMTQEQEEIKRNLQEAHGALEEQVQENLRIKVQAIYDDKRKNTFGRILEVFNSTYPEALPKLKAAHPDLIESELDICVLSYFPFRTKEVADILDLRENTISKYRANIKRKTQTDSIEELWKRFIA